MSAHWGEADVPWKPPLRPSLIHLGYGPTTLRNLHVASPWPTAPKDNSAPLARPAVFGSRGRPVQDCGSGDCHGQRQSHILSQAYPFGRGPFACDRDDLVRPIV